MRSLIALLLTISPAVATTYGTPVACAIVAKGEDPWIMTGGLEGEDGPSYYLSDTLFIGPELGCELHGADPADCGAEGIEWTETPKIVRDEKRATVKLEDYTIVNLARCP